jgi:hypothetical protein
VHFQPLRRGAFSGALDIKDVAGLCQVSEKTIRREIECGNLVATRIGRQLRIMVKSYEARVTGGLVAKADSGVDRMAYARRASSRPTAKPFLYEMVDQHRFKKAQ